MGPAIQAIVSQIAYGAQSGKMKADMVSYTKDVPIFVRGLSRSGGPLMLTVLDTHPEIAMSYEPYRRCRRWFNTALFILVSLVAHEAWGDMLFDHRLDEFNRYQRLIIALTKPLTAPNPPADVRRLTRHYFRGSSARTVPLSVKRVIAGYASQADLSEVRSRLVRQPADPGLLAGYLQQQYQRISEPGATRRARRLFAWNWVFWGRAAIVAYERTGETWFLEFVAQTFDHLNQYRGDVTAVRDAYRGKVLPSWPARGKNEKPGKFFYDQTVAGLMTLPACQFVRSVNQARALRERYAERVTRYIDIVRRALDAITEDYHQNERGYGYFVMPNLKRVEALNHSHAYASALACLNATVSPPLRPDMLDGLNRSYRASLWRTSAGSIAWGYAPRPPDDLDPPAEWLWKASTTILWPYDSYRFGGHFERPFMQELVRVFRTAIHRGGATFNARISRDDYLELTPTIASGRHPERLQALVVWIVLSDFDPEVRTIIENAVADRTDLFPQGWFGTARGAYAYAHRLAGDAQRFW